MIIQWLFILIKRVMKHEAPLPTFNLFRLFLHLSLQSHTCWIPCHDIMISQWLYPLESRNSGPFINQPIRALLKTFVIFIISTFAFLSLSFRTLWRRSKPSKTQRQQKEVWNSKNYIHPWRLTWNILIEVWKIIFLSKWVICRFHVNLPGCSFVPLHQIKHVLFPFTCSRLLLMEDIPNNHLRCKKNPVNNGTS